MTASGVSCSRLPVVQQAPGRAEALVELAPADDALVGGQLQKVIIPPGRRSEGRRDPRPSSAFSCCSIRQKFVKASLSARHGGVPSQRQVSELPGHFGHKRSRRCDLLPEIGENQGRGRGAGHGRTAGVSSGMPEARPIR